LALAAFQSRLRPMKYNCSEEHIFENHDFNHSGYITQHDPLGIVKSPELPLSESQCPEKSILDQLQRKIIGVRRGGGTVYRSILPDTSSSRSSQSACTSILSITGAIQDKMQSFRAASGRLNNFYGRLVVPHRNLPWEEDTRHTVQPVDWIGNNPQVMSDRARHITINRAYMSGVLK